MKKITVPIFFLLLSCAPMFASAQSAMPRPVSYGMGSRGFTYQIKTFTFTYGDQKFAVNSQTLSDWQGETDRFGDSIVIRQPLDAIQSLRAFYGLPAAQQLTEPTVYHYRLDKIYNYLATVIATSTDQSLQDPALTVENNRAINFTPPQNGRKLDVYKSAFDALAALENNQETTALTVNEIYPTKNLADTNALGIRELVAEGVSKFNGSPNNRRHNIAVGLEKFKGIIIPQGAEFSFDDNLGPVTAEAGFLPELVIKGSEGTIPELGGGLCQVSTTTFRAAMAGGLPITARRNHAYAVQYYSPQGTDATIYPGSADLKFINNTPGAILIWPYEKDKNTLVYDFYGTNDGRKVTLEKPVVYDRLPDGSMKATWTREVFNNNATTTDTFNSVYQSPALFHKTETFVSATGTPTSATPPPPKVQ
jgi:vancomycin resistance protein YoaR